MSTYLNGQDSQKKSAEAIYAGPLPTFKEWHQTDGMWISSGYCFLSQGSITAQIYHTNFYMIFHMNIKTLVFTWTFMVYYLGGPTKQSTDIISKLKLSGRDAGGAGGPPGRAVGAGYQRAMAASQI